HGPHFGLHPALPPRAVTLGADLSAQSPHKLLGALTQASWLLGRRGAVPEDAVRAALGVLHTTSPSALLLASLDEARRQIARDGRLMIDKALDAARRVRDAVGQVSDLEIVQFGRDDGNQGVPLAGADPTKLLIRVDGIGWNGFAAAARLRRLGVQVEMGTARHVLALATFGDDDETTAALIEGLEKLAAAHPPPGHPAAPWTDGSYDLSAVFPPSTEPVMRPREAALAPSSLAPLS